MASLLGVRKTVIVFSQESTTSGYLLLHKSLIMCEPKTQFLRFFLSGLFFNLRKSVPKDRGAIGKYISFQNPAYILQVTEVVPYNSTSVPAQLFILCL